ncbi:MAG: methylated-DNA--[protein]-cysteine S-methyltransferase [Pseudomonadota bacterium]
MPGATPHLYVRRTIESPVGDLRLFASDAGLAAILWRDDPGLHLRSGAVIEPGTHPTLTETERQLREYFDGERREFQLTLDFHGTDFQLRAWTALLTIPYGQTRTYAQMAALIGQPKAVRAVGAANSRNPISIVAPCHRVIGSNGTLTGFGGGLENKAKLLALESTQPDLFGRAADGAGTLQKSA